MDVMDERGFTIFVLGGYPILHKINASYANHTMFWHTYIQIFTYVFIIIFQVRMRVSDRANLTPEWNGIVWPE